MNSNRSMLKRDLESLLKRIDLTRRASSQSITRMLGQDMSEMMARWKVGDYEDRDDKERWDWEIGLVFNDMNRRLIELEEVAKSANRWFAFTSLFGQPVGRLCSLMSDILPRMPGWRKQFRAFGSLEHLASVGFNFSAHPDSPTDPLKFGILDRALAAFEGDVSCFVNKWK